MAIKSTMPAWMCKNLWSYGDPVLCGVFDAVIHWSRNPRFLWEDEIEVQSEHHSVCFVFNHRLILCRQPSPTLARYYIYGEIDFQRWQPGLSKSSSASGNNKDAMVFKGIFLTCHDSTKFRERGCKLVLKATDRSGKDATEAGWYSILRRAALDANLTAKVSRAQIILPRVQDPDLLH